MTALSSVAKTLCLATACAGLLLGNAVAGETKTQDAQSAAAAKEFKPMAQPLPLSVYRIQKTLGAENLYLFDCNPEYLYERSHLPGAVHVNVVDWEKRLPKDKKNAYLVFYCVNKLCNVSTETAFAALKLGYYNVYIMPDGIQGWIHHGFEYEGTGRNDKALTESLAKKAAKEITSPVKIMKKTEQ